MNLKNTYFGFTDNLKAMTKGRIEKTLNKMIHYNGKVITEKDFIYNLLLEGYTPKVEENYTYYSRKTGEETKPKTRYILCNFERSLFEVSKTSHDYALYLIENDFSDKQKATEYITVEQSRIEAEKQTEADKLAKEKVDKEAREKDQKEFEQWLNSQAEQYNNSEKLDLLKEIFLGEVGQFGAGSIRLLVLIDNFDNPNCKEKLTSWLSYFNTASLKTFFHITGVNLGHTDKAIQERLNSITSKDFTGMIPYKKRQDKVKNEMTDTFYIMIPQPTPHFEAVTGEFVRKYNLDMFIREVGDKHLISECRSGMLLTSARTKKEMYDDLKDNINRMGIESLNKKLEEVIKKYGLSPKYDVAITA